MQTPLESERQIAFCLGKVLTQALRESYQAFDGDLTMALVLGEIGQYSAAPVHEPPLHKEPGRFRSCNAYSISTASGIPRETVRRKLDKLLALGWIVEMENGSVGLNPQHEPPLAIVFSEFHRSILQTMREAMKTLTDTGKPHALDFD